MRFTKHVTVGGLTWAVVSANERAITHDNRHFLAVRCRSGRPWSIHELDANIAETGSAKPLRVFSERYDTGDLSSTVREICGEPPFSRTCDTCFAIDAHEPGTHCFVCGSEYSELHPSVPFEEHRDAMLARNAAHEVAA